MQGTHRDSTQPREVIDTPAALWLLESLAAFYRKPFDAELILKRFAPPFDLPALVDLLLALDFKAGLIEWPKRDFAALPVPAVAFVRASGEPAQDERSRSISLTPAVILKHGANLLTWIMPGQPAPRTLPVAEAHAQSQRALLLVAEAEPSVSEPQTKDGTTKEIRKPFGFSWFIAELLRHKLIWRDILLASLAIQIVGLATPLFTQVIIDKVIAHQSESTLIVLGVALVVFMLFTCVMSWLRQYLVLHTGYRIDAVLGEMVMRHLLRLPLPYFEWRPTGTLVARLHGIESLREFVSGAAVSLALDLPFLLIFLAVMFSYSSVVSQRYSNKINWLGFTGCSDEGGIRASS